MPTTDPEEAYGLLLSLHVTYEEWINELHPENVHHGVEHGNARLDVDYRFYLPASDHLHLWNNHPFVLHELIVESHIPEEEDEEEDEEGAAGPPRSQTSSVDSFEAKLEDLEVHEEEEEEEVWDYDKEKDIDKEKAGGSSSDDSSGGKGGAATASRHKVSRKSSGGGTKHRSSKAQVVKLDMRGTALRLLGSYVTVLDAVRADCVSW